MKRYYITVTGKVQGVWFRKHTQERASLLGIKGYVMNQPDGSVYLEAEGPDGDLELLVDWLKTEGSPSSAVDGVAVEEVPVANKFTEFTIKR